MLRDRIRPYIEKIVKREMTNRALAALLDVSEGTVCRVLKQMKVKREPATDRIAGRAASKASREVRKAAANSLSIKEAAAVTGCSTRTIYRLRNKK